MAFVFVPVPSFSEDVALVFSSFCSEGKQHFFIEALDQSNLSVSFETEIFSSRQLCGPQSVYPEQNDQI